MAGVHRVIPSQTNRLHIKPYWKGDSPAAIQRAARRLGRRRSAYIDINFQVCRDNVMGLHWSTAVDNGYRFIQVGNKRRAMTREELHRLISEWDTEDVVCWRRTKRAGLRYRSKVRPHTFSELVVIAKAKRVTICAELKSRRFATDPDIAVAMVSNMHKFVTTVYFMTLVTMWGWGPKLKNFKEAGGETALLPHGARRPTEVDEWSPWIDRYWGRWKS
jgi:hypothetical protein